MIATFTDFGVSGPYLGQVRAAVAALAPAVSVIDIFPDLPAFAVQAGAYLIPAYSQYLPADSVCLCVVDPGVGGVRRAIALNADDRWYVGPDNGLLSLVARRASRLRAYAISWRPDQLSDSFHGRDLFAPVCAMLAGGEALPDHAEIQASELANDWPDDLWQVVYIDHYGNCVTGVRADSVADTAVLYLKGVACRRQRTFSDAERGTLFWYANSNGLVEVAMTEGRAATQLAITTGEVLVPGGD